MELVNSGMEEARYRAQMDFFLDWGWEDFSQGLGRWKSYWLMVCEGKDRVILQITFLIFLLLIEASLLKWKSVAGERCLSHLPPTLRCQGWCTSFLSSTYESINWDSYQCQASNYVLQLIIQKQLRSTNGLCRHYPLILIAGGFLKILM